jgi:hypothetical protein
MKLFKVDLRCDVYYGEKLQSDHQVILTANDQNDAQQQAVELFRQQGLWTRSANPLGLPVQPRMLGSAELLQVAIINGRVVHLHASDAVDFE